MSTTESPATRSGGQLVDHVVPVPVYLAVFAALLVLTGLTVAVAMWDLGAYNALHTPLAMAIAAAKALLVVLYFMHVRHSERLTWIFIASAVLFLFFLISLTLSDYLTRDRDAAPSAWSARIVAPIEGHEAGDP
jgi:cytochrome c oxidase subunit 4